MTKPASIRRARPSEEGYTLVAVIFMLALFTIALAVALPKVAKEIQRDRELETMHRGKQYIRAVKLYYKKFGGYPPSVDALTKPTNNIRFLRKKYVDPTTGKEDWKPVRFGQNKAPTVMGFFGQPLGRSTIAGVGPGAGGLPGSSSLTQQAPTPDSNTASGTTPAAGSTTGSTSPTFGGGGIIGFSPNSTKQSILVYKTKNHYNEWEFVYDPIAEQMMQQGGNLGGNGLQTNGQSGSSGTVTGTGSGFGTTFSSGPGSGGPSGGGNPGANPPTPPTTPPQ
jgi:type II secretory pathway pseudopilin PulG